MRMWEIRENSDSRYGRKDSSGMSGMRGYKDDSYDDAYDCGFEDGYNKAMKEMRHSYGERRY